MASSAIVRNNSKTLSRGRKGAKAILKDFAYWLETKKRYKRPGNYVTNAKTFLKTYKSGSLQTQLLSYSDGRSYSLRSTLKRFYDYLLMHNIDAAFNDLDQEELPKSNPYVLIFLSHVKDHLSGDKSLNTYASILNRFFKTIGDDPSNINKRTVELFLFGRDLSDYTKRLYKAVLKSFCDWVAEYQQAKPSDLNATQKKIKRGLNRISYKSLREIISIKIRTRRSDLFGYHKESLTREQRNLMLKLCSNQRDRAIISLMAWNGLRTIEISRLGVSHCHLKRGLIEVWSKGRSSRSLDRIVLFNIPKRELTKYLKQQHIVKGKVFAGYSRHDIDQMIRNLFKKLGFSKSDGKYSPHSLRHTAGQLMYDKGIRLEFVQKTLRHANMETTRVYAQRAIDRQYMKKMPRNN